jgi:hypothetical protein
MLLQISRSDVTFYLGSIGAVITIFLIFWKATAGATLKRIEQDSVTKLDLQIKLSDLKDFLRENFISRKEFDSRVDERRKSSRDSDKR